MDIENKIVEYKTNEENTTTKKAFEKLIQQAQYVGELYSINYQKARVLIHDHDRHTVNGIPSLCFLLATRINLDDPKMDFRNEDSSVILLRVLDAASLPNNTEAERIRIDTAQRVSGELDKNWDSEGIMDIKTKHYLGYAAIECRIIGTFFFDKNDDESELQMKFGCDISNYYPNRGLKVFKPTSTALEEIVNFVDPVNIQDHEETYGKTGVVKFGVVRYASTNRKYQNVDNIPVKLHPVDLLAQKTALFGMTRTGKSNTTKIIAKSIYMLRKEVTNTDSIRIGQLIFDPNGEYANENVQDKDGQDEPNALKNVWTLFSGSKKDEEVVTYGIDKKKNDPDRKLMLINFFDEDSLQIGKEIINNVIQLEDSKYMKNFFDVSFDSTPDPADFSATTRHKRHILIYRALLNKAGYLPPNNLKANLTGLFNQDLLKKMELASEEDKTNGELILSSSKILSKSSASWDMISNACEGLFYFLKTNVFKQYEHDYINKSSTNSNWADSKLRSILEMFAFLKGANIIGRCKIQHSNSVNTDFAEDIYNDLCNGKLVIVDQSSGEPDFNDSVARRVMWHIFRNNQNKFRQGVTPNDILVYIEEAHNLLPAGNSMDLKDVWVRTAKEGAKYRIGMLYATQEVSSIHKNILKNTSNWFISHLNNTDETKELCKFYDFADFEPSIRRAQDKGFLRVKTLSNYFVVPAQVDKFSIRDKDEDKNGV